MSRARTHRLRPALAVCAIGTMLMAAGAANATIITATPGIDFSTQAATITFGNSSFVFSDIASALPGDPPAAASTKGGAKISSIFGGIADFGAGAAIDQTGELYTFAAFTKPAVIPNSAADDYIGLAFLLAGSLHYGYAEISGTELVSYGYQTMANTGIQTAAAVAEPATLAVLGSGLLGLVAMGHSRRRAPVA